MENESNSTVSNRAEIVVLVPGIGFGGFELLFLSWFLRKQGYSTKVFWHNPWRRPLSVSAKALQKWLCTLKADVIHLVAHSLGGLVVLQMFLDYPEQRPGRMVTLGTPHCGCLTARRLLKAPAGRWYLGPGLVSVCESSLPLPPGREVGGIAGRLNFLIGLVLRLEKPNDTIVCVEETQHSGMVSHLVLPVSHGSMLFSPGVARHIAYFLRYGGFVPITGPHPIEKISN